MSLPNLTKTNYGNVDDITPTEMNNVGSNLISLGQKIQQVVDDTWITTNADWNGTAWDRIDIAKAASALQIGIDGSKNFWNAGAGANPIVWVKDRQLIQRVGDDTWVLVNAYWTGTVWNRIDIAKAASALQIGIDGSKTGWNAAAGANPIVWVQGEKWDASGQLVAGVVPLSRILRRKDFGVSNGVANMTVSIGTTTVGDILEISYTAKVQKDTTAGSVFISIFNVGSSGTIRYPNNEGSGRVMNKDFVANESFEASGTIIAEINNSVVNEILTFNLSFSSGGGSAVGGLTGMRATVRTYRGL